MGSGGETADGNVAARLAAHDESAHDAGHGGPEYVDWKGPLVCLMQAQSQGPRQTQQQAQQPDADAQARLAAPQRLQEQEAQQQRRSLGEGAYTFASALLQ